LRLLAAFVIASSCFVDSASSAEQGMLQAIREDVRGGDAPSSNSPSDDRTNDNCDQGYEPYGWGNDQSAIGCDSAPRPNANGDATSALGVVSVAGALIASPLWLPHAMLGDDFDDGGYFLHFPYDGHSSYIRTSHDTGESKPWAVRLDVGYAETFDRLDSINGHLLIETAPRFGLAASVNHLEERLSGGGHDQLEIGDCNFVYRFAQNKHAEFRAGLGFNWLNDAQSTDLGFNFSYALDLYPRKPWVLSAELDAGTLGDTGLFRFRSTAGVVFHGVETFAGYEYTDIGRTHWNSLIAGLRFWF
jgi:hypothetical protein